MLVTLVFLCSSTCFAQQEAWVPDVPGGPDPIGGIDTSATPGGVVPLPDFVDRRIRKWFGRYTRLVAPNGKPIHILAQDGWREDQIIRARKVLQHILADAPGTRYGSDKAPIANAMADRRATLVLFDTVQQMERAFGGGLGSVELGCQDLRANECPVEGDADYLRHETRDAAFEEILHLVHDYGIRPVHPAYDEAIHQANLKAANRGIWKGCELIESFFPPFLTYTAELSPDFNGTFFLRVEPGLRYTHKSQHLVSVSLSGSKDASIVGN